MKAAANVPLLRGWESERKEAGGSLEFGADFLVS